MTRIAVSAMTILALLLGGAGHVMAGVIFSNFGPGDSYDVSHGVTIGRAGGIGGPHIDVAAAFTPVGNSFTLDSIEVAIGLGNPGGLGFGPNLLDVVLTTSAGGFPGTVLETFHFVNAMGVFGFFNAPLVADSLLHSVLSEGTQYWVVASAPDLSTNAAWNHNTTSDPAPLAARQDGGPWFLVSPPRGAFRVRGTVVPEPSTFTLLGFGIFGLLGYALRRKRI